MCSACGAENPPGKGFCGDCGRPLEVASVSEGVAPAATAAPVAERGLVSVLFADLVGFTTLSESRDSEEVRELLSAYFDACRRLIERYGGTVEKFIGDAVMAVWGAPVTQEDDAERAVRLRSSSSGRHRARRRWGLKARAGVLTGEAAVCPAPSGRAWWRAIGQHRLAGPAAAEPGTVLVGESTKRATEAAIVYEDAGHSRAQGQGRAAAALAGAARNRGARRGPRSTGLEAPFVGRARELRMMKELFHASAEERKAQLVSVTGSRESASLASPGSSRSTSTASPRTSGGTGAAASPTARAWPTGRWRRW